MIFIPFLILFVLHALPVFAEPSRYDIVATYNDAAHRIIGHEEITFTNRSSQPLSELYLVLYPNLYFNARGDIDPDYYLQTYPVAFNSGGIEITAIEDLDGKGLPFSPVPLQNDTLVIIHLPVAIPPQETFRFIVEFKTSIPEKIGIFGHYKDLTTLQGGWHPYLAPFSDGKWQLDHPPPKSHFRVRFSLRDGLDVIGSDANPSGKRQENMQTYLMETKQTPFFSLSIGEGFTQSETTVAGIHIAYHSLRRNRSYTKQIQDITESALLFFLAQSGPVPPMHLSFAEAYLHQDLVGIGTNLLYLNNKFFKVFYTFKRFHAASLAKGLYQLLWQRKRPDEELWVIESLAKRDAEAFVERKYGKEFSLSKYLKPFGFIPIVDQILYSRKLPLRQVYFREAIPPILSEDIRFFNRPSSETPGIFTKLKTLMGKAVFERALEAYRDQGNKKGEIRSFRKVLLKSSQQDLNPLIDLWLNTRPEIDFKIKDMRYEKKDGSYRTTVLIEKHGKGIEPLQIVASEKNGNRIPIVWAGSSDKHALVLRTPTRIKTVELDPHKISNDPNRRNNRVPRDWKVLVDKFNVNYDFQTNDPSYTAGLLFQYLYDTKNWVRLLFSDTSSGDISHIGYTRTLKQNHLVTTGLSYEKRAPSRSHSLREEAGYLSLAYSFIFPDLPLLTETVQRLTNTFPSFNVTLNYNQQFTDQTDDHSFIMKLDFRRTIPFNNYHSLSTRLLIGQSVGNLFENRRFSLGGSHAMRGYSPLTFEGENLGLLSLEYRFPVFYDSDINLFGLAHTHAWQGAVFADTGMVSGSHNVFQFSNYQSDVGIGMRFFIDLFGIYPLIVRFDIAKPIDSPIESEDTVHYYLNLGQAF